MTDVRLTATNPDDSSVVPVACNAKGELKLEEAPVFDGNLGGDLTVSGSATFASNIKATRFDIPAGTWSSSGSNNGIYLGGSQLNGTWYDLGAINANDSSVPWGIKPDGSAKFAGDVTAGSGGTFYGFVGVNGGGNSSNYAAFYGACLDSSGRVFVGSDLSSGTDNVTSKIYANGSATFAGGKAGFTAEGHLWCTTTRGDTVMLDFTSNGLATWVSYTPPRRISDLKDKWSEKDVIRPVPEESSQDEPETPQ